MRAFIAIELGDRVCARIEEELLRLRKLAPEARWVKSESLHLTLAFLGEIANTGVSAVSEAIARVAARHPPLALGARGHGTFGPLDSPKVLWVALSGELLALASLQADLTRELAELGHTPEFERFEPHVTLARSKNPRGDAALARCAAALGDVALGELRVGEVSLFSTQTHLEGMGYTAVSRHRLVGAPR